MEQPAADAGAAVGMFTGRLEGALQHISTHTAKKPLIHVAHKPLEIIAHPGATVIPYNNGKKKMEKLKSFHVLAHLSLIIANINYNIMISALIFSLFVPQWRDFLKME